MIYRRVKQIRLPIAKVEFALNCSIRHPTRRHISIGWSTTSALVLSSPAVRRTSITRQARWTPFINGPSFARDISRCSVVTCALPAAHIHIWQSYKWENDNIYCVPMPPTNGRVCVHIRPSISSGAAQSSPRRKTNRRHNNNDNASTDSVGIHRAHATRPSEKLKCLHTPSARCRIRAGDSFHLGRVPRTSRLAVLWSIVTHWSDSKWVPTYLPTRIFVVLLLFIFWQEAERVLL